MVKIYACLIGNWVCLNDDSDCKIGVHGASPSTWWEENADIWAPFKRNEENTLYQLDYINIVYKGTNYRINPTFIQIVNQ
ncbi:hypothetical protein AAAV04_12065 [Phascolarctobacterium faecium]|jgi:hypothetical protein|uniref:hypothetical protein n=1 Tax=Phascolarctobacterium faecium TaxID=33025 RepID=UPI00265DD700|nr:hypothetical protein [Phascolarctobacterium faecium]